MNTQDLIEELDKLSRADSSEDWDRLMREAYKQLSFSRGMPLEKLTLLNSALLKVIVLSNLR